MLDPQDTQALDRLLSHLVEQKISDTEMEELGALLLNNPAAQQRYVRALQLHAHLQLRFAQASIPDGPSAAWDKGHSGRARQPRKSWKRWIPQLALASGLCAGFFSATLLHSQGAPWFPSRITLLHEGFEEGKAPAVTGMPSAAGFWSGDFSRLALGEDRLRPFAGKAMLRLLSAEYEGKPGAPTGRTSGIWQLIDLRPFKSSYEDGLAEVHLSARINAQPFDPSLEYTGHVSIHALEASAVTQGSHQDWRALDPASQALNRGDRTPLDRDPATWQRLNTALRLPSHTDFLLIQVAVKQTTPPEVPIQFGTQYVDDIRLSLGRRPLLH
jgi:hypothetical protein